MVESRKAQIVDGYTVVKVVRHGKKADAPPEPPSETLPGKKEKKAEDISHPHKHIGSTVMPTKHVIRCYECGYEFPLTVRVQNTHCPKCRTALSLIDYTIDGEWTETLKTAASVRITPNAVLKTGRIVANDVILEGRVDGATLEAFRRLEIGAGAVFDEKFVSAPNIRIATGADVAFHELALFHDVEICGHFKGDLRSSGMVHIKTGGCLEGTLETGHLIVEDGGGLMAECRVEAPGGVE